MGGTKNRGFLVGKGPEEGGGGCMQEWKSFSSEVMTQDLAPLT